MESVVAKSSSRPVPNERSLGFSLKELQTESVRGVESVDRRFEGGEARVLRLLVGGQEAFEAGLERLLDVPELLLDGADREKGRADGRRIRRGGVQRVAEGFLRGHRLLLKRLTGLVARVAQRLELLELRVGEPEEVLQHGDGIRPEPSRSAGARRGTSGRAAHVRLRGERKGDEE